MLRRNIEKQEPRRIAHRSANPATLTGKVTLTPRGFGFVTTADGTTYFLAPHQCRTVLPGDEVEFLPMAKVAPTNRSDILALSWVRRPAGRLICGAQWAGYWRLTSDDPCFKPLALSTPWPDFQDGDVLAVSYPAYCGPADSGPLPVTVERTLGARGAPQMLRDYVIWRYGFERPLPPVSQASPPANDAVRLDLRALALVTIDGESTKDVDDAIHVAKSDEGWLVHIAVADVSSVVQEGSELDKAAAERGTSLYLAGNVIPMLPDELSTGACSLQEGQDRRALVLRVNLNETGHVLDYAFQAAWINSAARLSYTQVSAWQAGTRGGWAAAVDANLQAMTQCYRVLHQLRVSNGVLEFDEPEPQLITQPDGAVGLQWVGRTDAHKIVETFMLLANTLAANHLVQRYGTAILRKQPPPLQADWHALRGWASLEVGLDLPEEPSLSGLAQLSRQAEAETRGIAAQKIRAIMRPATYAEHSPETSSGHFSIGVELYTHFTSPIRRYVDLITHRLLLKPEGYSLTAADLLAIRNAAVRCAERSGAARKAERYLWDTLKRQALQESVPKSTILAGRLIKQSAQGAKLYLTQWQLIGWVAASHLAEAGFAWRGTQWCKGLSSLQEGREMPCRWVAIVAPRPANPELQLTLAG